MSLTFENVAISTKKKINQTFWLNDSSSGFFDDLFFLGIGIGTSLKRKLGILIVISLWERSHMMSDGEILDLSSPNIRQKYLF